MQVPVMRFIYRFVPLFIFFIFPFLLRAQTNSLDEVDVALHSSEGLRLMTKDSSSAINIRFRMQNRVDFESEASFDAGLIDQNGFVKRMRLRSAGYVMSKRVTYSFQLGFSPGDMDISNSPYPQIIRDAMVFYRASDNFKIGFGQTKLPGNRQRVVSSGEQQFVDRSLLNATFNLDRDFGMQAYYKTNLGKAGLNLQGALSTGDGRNITDRGKGMAYTGRVEFLPMGKFKMGGDYFEGDWAYEETPKISLGSTYSFNDNATRVGGQIGRDLYQSSDITTVMADALIKYRGWASATEYVYRNAANPITRNDENLIRNIYIGSGLNTQLSYQFRNHLEIAARYTNLEVNDKIGAIAEEVEEYTIGVNYYYRWHRVKIQSDITFQKREIPLNDIDEEDRNPVILRFQVEFGI